jgi:UDP-N-acetylglucosamine transferase subunit ALG13
VPFAELVPYPEMIRLMAQATVVVTHGGPASIMMALQLGKKPIVVPRMARFGEHVNDHQVAFCRRLEAEGRIRAVYRIEQLVTHIQAVVGEPAGAALPPNPQLLQLVDSLTAYCRAIGISSNAGGPSELSAKAAAAEVGNGKVGGAD